jgi:hypothetical protein
LIFERSVKFRNYYIQVEFSPEQDLSQYFSYSFLNAQYVTEGLTKFLLAIRYFFFSVSLIASLAYCLHCYFSHQKKGGLRFEQRLTLPIALALTCFNDPFSAIYVFNPNPASSFFAVFFLSLFVISLVGYWMNMLEYIVCGTDANKWQRVVLYLCMVISFFGSYLAYHILTL